MRFPTHSPLPPSKTPVHLPLPTQCNARLLPRKFSAIPDSQPELRFVNIIIHRPTCNPRVYSAKKSVSDQFIWTQSSLPPPAPNPIKPQAILMPHSYTSLSSNTPSSLKSHSRPQSYMWSASVYQRKEERKKGKKEERKKERKGESPQRERSCASCKAGWRDISKRTI